MTTLTTNTRTDAIATRSNNAMARVQQRMNKQAQELAKSLIEGFGGLLPFDAEINEVSEGVYEWAMTLDEDYQCPQVEQYRIEGDLFKGSFTLAEATQEVGVVYLEMMGGQWCFDGCYGVLTPEEFLKGDGDAEVTWALCQLFMTGHHLWG